MAFRASEGPERLGINQGSNRTIRNGMYASPGLNSRYATTSP